MSKIEQNTTDLQAILDAVNALPEAGSGDPVLQEKTVSPSTSAQNVTPDSGYDGLSKVTVNAMPTATQATPSISVSSAGLITASSTQSAGYVAAGTKSATKQLTVQAAKTITPSTSAQTAVASGRYTTGAITVAAIPSTYVKPTTKKAATTYTPGTSNQTIAAGTYCSGAQTIKGDSNLVAANIKKGVSIFGVTGTHEGGEDLDAVISEQATLITSLQTALENKASGGSGGGSVETCSLVINTDGGCSMDVYATIADSSGIRVTFTSVYENESVTIYNVVIGSLVYIFNVNQTGWITSSNGVSVHHGYRGIVKICEIIGEENPFINIYADPDPM